MIRVLRLSIFAVVLLAIGVFGALLWTCYEQARAFVYPSPYPITESPNNIGISEWEAVEFQSVGDVTLRGWYIPPHPEADGASIVFVHGLGGTKQVFWREVRLLHERGYGMLLFDLRNHGESDQLHTTMGYFETDDVIAAFEFLSSQPGVNEERIALWGTSMGGSTAIRAMARIPQAYALVAEAAYTSPLDVTATGVRERTGLPGNLFGSIIMWMSNQLSGGDYFAVRPIEDIADLDGRPVLLMHGMDDPVVPFDHSVRLYEAAQEPKFFFAVPDGGHGALWVVEPEAYNETVTLFLERNLRAEPFAPSVPVG